VMVNEIATIPVGDISSLNILEQITIGLACLHNKNIIHRDLKPYNILLTKLSDGTVLVKIADFGISRLLPDT